MIHYGTESCTDNGCPMCVFNRTWALKAEAGECDALGSAEYWRVVQEWLMARMESEPDNFIPLRTQAWPMTDPPYTEPGGAQP